MAEEDSITISKSQFDIAVRAAQLLDKLIADPKNGMAAKKMIRETNPDLKIFPEIDIVASATEPVNAEVSALKEQLAKLSDDFTGYRKSVEDEKGLGSLKERVAAARKQFGLTDEGEEKLIKRMQDHNSADVEAAAAWVASQNPPPKPVSGPSYLPDSMNLFGSGEESDDADIRKLHENPVKWFDNKVADIINNPENYPELSSAA